jgi:hypothetical protein
MEEGTQKKLKAVLERENLSTMQRQTILNLGEELTDRTQ